MTKHYPKYKRNNTAPGIKPPKNWFEGTDTSIPLKTTQVDMEGKPKTVTYHKQMPKTKKPIESMMIVPYISTKTFPDYVRMQIESYDWMPEMVHYVMNNVKLPIWKNKFDAKAIEAFKLIKPTKYFIHHASDMYVMPVDLLRMKKLLDNDPKCCCVGLYPIGGTMRHTKIFEDFVLPTRISVWKADVFGKYLEKGLKSSKAAFKGIPLDAVFYIANEAIKDGWHTMIDAKSRAFHVNKEEYKTLWIAPDNQA